MRQQKLSWACAALAAHLTMGIVGVHAQQPGTLPASIADNATQSPAAALAEALSSACSQDQKGFTRYLTVRNAQVFARLNAPARVALMKRFVLLDEPGKPSITPNDADKPLVRCETPSATTEMRIGAAETNDNLAFLPLEIRAANDAASASARQTQIGLLREAGAWKLLSVGLLMLDLPSLEAEWDRAAMEESERATLINLKQLAQALESYRQKYLRLPDSLARLGPPVKGAPSADAAGLVDAELASGSKDGYIYRYVILGASAVGAQAKYELAATPRIYATTGRRSFFRESSGVLHAADHQGALGSADDPRAQ